MSIIEHNKIPRGDYAAIIGHASGIRSKNVNESSLLSEADAGEWMLQLATRLYPICRSLTGPGVCETLGVLQTQIPLEIHSVKSGTQVFDWNVPQEWTLHAAFIEDAAGERVVDAADLNLHVVGYSTPIDTTLTWRELKPHLHSLPEKPTWVPYRTSYYHPTWGFCLSHRQFESLAARGEDAQYRVQIDATLAPGELNYGEFCIPGETSDEVIFSCHICHPSLANDNLSGNVVAVELAKWLSALPKLRYSYRFLFVPATIGTLCWLAANQQNVANIKHGLVLTLLGDSGYSTYKQSRRANAEIDRVVEHVLQHSGTQFEIRSFTPQGYDERQYCSPGFNLPVGCFMRTPHGEYPEYHTSADNLSLISSDSLHDSWQKCCEIVSVLERNRKYQNLSPFGEPQLGKHGLYQRMGGDSTAPDLQTAVQWVLNLSDGEHSLLDIAERAELPFTVIHQASQLLVETQLLAPHQLAVEPAPDAAPLSLDELWFS